MLENFEYFFYGYPKYKNENIYALYQPVTDCFLLCTSNLHTANNVKILLSSKYSLYTVKLNSASNYQPNIIDNTCCENWTLSNRDEMLINRIGRGTPTVEAQELCATSPKISVDWSHEKKYAMLCCHWFDKLDCHTTDGEKLANLINLDPSLKEIDFNKIKSQIFYLLYRGRDVLSVQHEISQLVNEHVKNNLY